jgi:hypothetical protein
LYLYNNYHFLFRINTNHHTIVDNNIVIGGVGGIVIGGVGGIVIGDIVIGGVGGIGGIVIGGVDGIFYTCTSLIWV